MGIFQRINDWRKNLDWGSLLVIASLLIQVPRFTYAFLQTDSNIGEVAVATFTGPGFAILVALGAYYCWETWHSVRINASKTSKQYKNSWIILVFMIAQIVMEPLIAWPPIIATLRKQPLPDVLEVYGVLLWWSLLVAIVPTVVLAGVSIAHAMRKSLNEDASPKRYTSTPVTSYSIDTQSAEAYQKRCYICGKVFHAPMKYSGHFRSEDHRNVKEAIKEGKLVKKGNIITLPDGSPFDYVKFTQEN